MHNLSAFSRFFAKVQLADSGCWLWTGSISAKGYGRFGLNGRNRLAHGVAWELFYGPIPEGMTVDHICHTRENCMGGNSCIHRRCVNPSHFQAVPMLANLERGYWPAARYKTHCPQGHLLLHNSTRRICRECGREWSRDWARRERRARGAPVTGPLRTHCPRGHAYDEANTYWHRGKRQCIECRRMHSRAYKQRRREGSSPSIH